MKQVQIYRDHVLTAVEQPAGGWRIEIAHINAADRSVFTSTFSSCDDALAAAKRIVDRLTRSIH